MVGGGECIGGVASVLGGVASVLGVASEWWWRVSGGGRWVCVRRSEDKL